MQFCYTCILFYPTIAALFDKNRPAVYTITIYGRLYMAELNIAKMQMAAIFSLSITLFGCSNNIDVSLRPRHVYLSPTCPLYTQVYKDRDQIF